MKPAVTYPDPERLIVDILNALLPASEDVTVGVALPDGWDHTSSTPHLQVACDGTPLHAHPVVIHSTVRVTAWAASTSDAKRLANLAFGLLCAYSGDESISTILPLTGVLPARDEYGAEVASVTVRVTVRSTPI